MRTQMRLSASVRRSTWIFAWFMLLAAGLPSSAQEYATPDPTRSQVETVEQAYGRVRAAEESGDIVGSTEILEWIVFESGAGLEPSTIKEIELVVESAGIDRAIKRFSISTGVVTNAYSALGERYLSNGYPDAAIPLLSAAAVQRSHSLLDAIQAEDPGYEFGTLSHALVRARNIRNTFKALNEIDVLEDPNLYSDLFNLGLAMRDVDNEESARRALSVVAAEAAAGPLRELALDELEEL